jgi:elastin
MVVVVVGGGSVGVTWTGSPRSGALGLVGTSGGRTGPSVVPGARVVGGVVDGGAAVVVGAAAMVVGGAAAVVGGAAIVVGGAAMVVGAAAMVVGGAAIVVGAGAGAVVGASTD